jgi:GH15 family glucan-1,4-alpha-glucosidase
LHQARLGDIPESVDVWQLQKAFAEHLEKIWQQPDQGIWEVRGRPQQFTHSKIMAWVAVDRAVKSAEQFGLDGPVDRWRALRNEIHADVCANGFNPGRNAFVQAYGSDLIDASLLMVPLVGFLPASDPRVRGTVEAIEKELVVDGFVLRYDSEATDDGLPPGEGAFLACSFWLIENYVLLGRTADAEAMFERLLGLANDVGLLSEEYDAQRKRQIGNFPQGFSHLALLSSAFAIERPQRAKTGELPISRI